MYQSKFTGQEIDDALQRAIDTEEVATNYETAPQNYVRTSNGDGTFTYRLVQGGQGGGDMESQVYDPDGIVKNAFDSKNHKYSGELVSLNVSDALDELYDELQNIDVELDADKISYNNSVSGLDAENVQDAIDEIKSKTYFTTLDTDWTGDAPPYTKEEEILGIVGTDNPIIDLVLTDDYYDDTDIGNAWTLVYRAVTDEDTITFYAHDIPEVEIPIQIKVVK